MDIEIRCEQCNTYLEIEKEYTDRGGLKITVNPCSECMDYWKKLYESICIDEIDNEQKTDEVGPIGTEYGL